MEDWADADESFQAPLHPDDRLWRHPSELRTPAAGTATALVAPKRTSPGARLALCALVVAAMGAAWWTARMLDVDAPTQHTAAAAGAGETTLVRATESTERTTLATVSTTIAATSLLQGLEGREATRGFLVTDVEPSNPIARAGLRVGDLILAVGGIQTNSRKDLVDAVGVIGLKDEVAVEVSRGTRALRLTTHRGT
jgi:hypothetical protein